MRNERRVEGGGGGGEGRFRSDIFFGWFEKICNFRSFLFPVCSPRRGGR